MCSNIKDEITFNSFHKARFFSIPLGGGVETGRVILKLGSIYPRGYMEPRLNIPPVVGPRLIIPGVYWMGVC